LDAGTRRLNEELCFTTELNEEFSFIYRAELDQDMIEHELDHVLTGTYNGILDFNTDEVCAVKYISMSDLETDIVSNPENYTAWFKIIFSKVKDLIG
jgi:isopentenyl-diphosphate delta-isomerase